MKKVFFFAVTALVMCAATSCKEGKCACVGVNSDGKTIRQDLSQGGYSDQMACDEIKAMYPNATNWDCRAGKTSDTYND